MASLPDHIYEVRLCSFTGLYLVAFWSVAKDQWVYHAPIDFVPTEEQMNEMQQLFPNVDILLEDGPSPHFPLYKE